MHYPQRRACRLTAVDPNAPCVGSVSPTTAQIRERIGITRELAGERRRFASIGASVSDAPMCGLSRASWRVLAPISIVAEAWMDESTPDGTGGASNKDTHVR